MAFIKQNKNKNNFEDFSNNGPVEIVSIKDLELHPDNPRQGDVGAIVQSISANGWFGTLVAQRSTRRVLAGNHRLQAAQGAGIEKVPVYWVDVDDRQAKRILLADNRTSDLATYDDNILAQLLSDIAKKESLEGTGYDEEELNDILANLDEPLSFDDEELTHREMINLPDVTIADPEIEPERNSIWKLGPHTLIVADVITDWKLWKPFLEGEAEFVPYPGPFVAVAAELSPALVLVHPDKYMAGHVLSKWNSINEPAERIQ